MNLYEALELIANTAKENNIPKPYIVGGVPRDKLLGRLKAVEDIDLTTGDDSIHKLSELLRAKLPDAGYKKYPDGHSHLIIDGIKFDFSSNYHSPQVPKLLSRAGVKDPSTFQTELYSRDFTINCLLMDFDLETIHDVTGLGRNDISAKRIRTPIPAKFTLANNNKRIVRAVVLAAKLGMSVDDEIVEWVSQHPESFANVNPKFLRNKVQEALNYDEGKTIELMKKMNIWQYAPELPSLVGRGR